MKNVRCCKCGRILAVADDATETVCTQCGAKLKFAPPAPAPAPPAPAPPAPAQAPPAPAQAPPAPAAAPVAAPLAAPGVPPAPVPFAPGNAAGHSYFDGKLRQYVGLNIVCLLQMIFTLFIGTPWVIIKKKKWLLKHTIVYGQRLKLTARGSQLIGNFIKWFLLSVITLGIYSMWIPIKYQQWYASHLEFDGDPIPPREMPKKERKALEKKQAKLAKKAK